MNATAAQTAWLAAGVRHEVLMRVLPALRHDMAGPLSVARMGNTVLKRYLAAQPFDAEQSRKRLEQTEEQLNLLLVAIRTLNRWDADSSERGPAAAAVAVGLELARPMLDLHGVVLEQSEAGAVPTQWPDMAPARALYAVIAVLCYLQDSATGPTHVVVSAEGDSLRFQATATAPAAPDEPRFPGRPLRLDADTLRWLSEDLAWPMRVQVGEVVLECPRT